MNRLFSCALVALVVFVGAILSALIFENDGLQIDDFQQACLIALMGGIAELWISSRRRM